ncbi:uncharacterized protein METZ01_LOCUS376226 [marine metagenome]|uniref:Uncharacterized protein n=1 Tax=marine metagenome TaxID=408172 RepID=A0A382TNP6_9ZZZZ
MLINNHLRDCSNCKRRFQDPEPANKTSETLFHPPSPLNTENSRRRAQVADFGDSRPKEMDRRSQYPLRERVDARFVGVYWFQWIDQSAAGRKDRENHRCGFIDVAGRAYPEFVDAVSRVTRAMYPLRSKGKLSTLQILQGLITD